MTYQETISLSTVGHRDMHDITGAAAAAVARSGIRTGTAHIFNLGSTAIVGTIEYEPGLERDLPDLLDRLIPASRGYGHEKTWHDGNGHSHLQATLMGQELTVPVARKACARHLAADIPSRMQHQTARQEHRDNSDGRSRLRIAIPRK